MSRVPLARRNMLADRRSLVASVVGGGLAVMLILTAREEAEGPWRLGERRCSVVAGEVREEVPSVMWDSHEVGWGWWLVMWTGMLAFWVAIVWIAIAAVRGNRPERTTAAAVLAERFARGEIDADEYRRRLEVLRRDAGDRAA